MKPAIVNVCRACMDETREASDITLQSAWCHRWGPVCDNTGKQRRIYQSQKKTIVVKNDARGEGGQCACDGVEVDHSESTGPKKREITNTTIQHTKGKYDCRGWLWSAYAGYIHGSTHTVWQRTFLLIVAVTEYESHIPANSYECNVVFSRSFAQRTWTLKLHRELPALYVNTTPYTALCVCLYSCKI